MSKPKTILVTFTGEKHDQKTIRTMIGNQVFAEWKKGDVYPVLDSKVRNHIKYPFFELAKETAKAKKIDLKESEVAQTEVITETEPKGKTDKGKKMTVKKGDVEKVDEVDEVLDDAEVVDEVEVVEDAFEEKEAETPVKKVKKADK